MGNLQNKKYNIIYADPPWHYNARNNPSTRYGQGVHAYYPTMKLEEIKKLNIPAIADDNCALFMWCTTSAGDSNLAQKLELFEHWGFRLVNIGFTWVKTNADGSPFFGTGHYSKSNAEHCFLGIKGSMKVQSNKVSSLIISPREKHSKKPDIVRSKIVELFGDLPRCELFARQNADGWDSVGLDLNGIDVKDFVNRGV